MNNTITKSPLCWPDAVPRTAPHRRGSPKFDDRSLDQAARFTIHEINRLNKRRWDYQDENVIISSNLKLRQDGLPLSNQPEPADSGIAVYFTLKINRNGKLIERPIVMSCDKWKKPADNLYAIGKDIEAQRSRERWGCTNYEQAFRGYLAIPERCGGKAWWETLGILPSANRDTVEQAYKIRAKVAHPDTAGTNGEFVALKEAFDQAMAQFSKEAA